MVEVDELVELFINLMVIFDLDSRTRNLPAVPRNLADFRRDSAATCMW